MRTDKGVQALSFDQSGELLAVGMNDGLVAIYRFPQFLFQRRLSDKKLDGFEAGEEVTQSAIGISLFGLTLK